MFQCTFISIFDHLNLVLSSSAFHEWGLISSLWTPLLIPFPSVVTTLFPYQLVTFASEHQPHLHHWPWFACSGTRSGVYHTKLAVSPILTSGWQRHLNKGFHWVKIRSDQGPFEDLYFSPTIILQNSVHTSTVWWPMVIRMGPLCGSLLRQPLTCIDWTNHWLRFMTAQHIISSVHHSYANAHYPKCFAPLLSFKLMFPVVVAAAVGLHSSCFLSVAGGCPGCKECFVFTPLSLPLTPMLPGVSAPP